MNTFTRKILPFASLLLLIGFLCAFRPNTFMTWDNILNVLRRSSVHGIIAIGMTMVIISAGIDLSVGSIIAFSGMVGALSLQHFNGIHAAAIGTLFGILTGTLCGAFNGTLITKLKLPAFIVTLGTMSFFRGIALVMRDGQPIDAAQYTFLGTGTLLGFPVSVFIFAGIVALGYFILNYTPLGRHTYAIGSNKEAAFHAGIGIDRTIILIYTITGMLSGLAAMILTSRTVSAQPTAGIGDELDIIAAVVIGGASLSGGQGTIIGTVVGTLLINFLRNGCTLMDISTNAQKIVIGMIIIAAVAIDRLARSKSAAPPTE